MKRTTRVTTLMTILVLASASLEVLAQAGSTQGAPTQVQVQQQKKQIKQHTIRDQDRNGVCDVCGQGVASGLKKGPNGKADKGKHWGLADSTGNQGSRPQDGSGYGANSGRRMGSQDGSGILQGRAAQSGSNAKRRGGGRN